MGSGGLICLQYNVVFKRITKCSHQRYCPVRYLIEIVDGYERFLPMSYGVPAFQ